MLILTRKAGECIVIGESIRVYILEIRGRQVRIGIEAPREIPVHREEIFRLIQSLQEVPAPEEDPADSPEI